MNSMYKSYTVSDLVPMIEHAALEGDSVGGVLETAVLGLPAGVGEPWFDSFESIVSHILFSIPAVKGVQFGKGGLHGGPLGLQRRQFHIDPGD